jgi:hypothetical protein
MATTTNFGWETPDDTDLVKDGAAAMRTLGNSIDTSFVDLKGGTTGQVLAKASATDLDFSWVAQDDSNAIQNAIVDAKGDLIGATAADTPARLAVGTNGQVLTADSTTATGLKWATPATAAGYENNSVINSAFQIWQRGTSFTGTFATGTGTYTADRWLAYIGAGANTISRQVTNDTTNLPFIQYCTRVARDSGQTTTNTVYFANGFESVNSIPLAGKTVTLSFYARAGANYSSASNALLANVITGTGTDQNVISGLTGGVNAISQTATLTTTWQRFSYSATLATTATQAAVRFDRTPVGTAGANDYYEVTGVQLEVGSTATAFHTNSPTIEAELAACQRYYERYEVSTGSNLMFGTGFGQSSTNIQMMLPCFVTKRVAPTSIDFSNLSWANGIASQNITAMTINSSNTFSVFANATTTGATGGNAYALANRGSGTGIIALNSEL